MSPAQIAALRLVVAAEQPVKISPATAAVLRERYAYIEPANDGQWTATDKGREMLAGMDHTANYSERCSQLTRESKDHAERVVAWLRCHGYLGGMNRYDGQNYRAQDYAAHFAACDAQGLDPVRPPGDPDWVEADVRMAAKLLREYDEVQAKAQARDCGVEIEYTVAPSHPKTRADASRPRPDGIVDLMSYRRARADPDGA